MIKEDIFMPRSKIELRRNANEIKERLGASALKKESLPLGTWSMIEIIFKYLAGCFQDIFGFQPLDALVNFIDN